MIDVMVVAITTACLLQGCDRQGTSDHPETEAEGLHPTTAPSTAPTRPGWPATVDEAVGRLMTELAEEDIGTIRDMKREDLTTLHVGLGMWIRNEFGLWGGNEALLRATGQSHPDQASSVIIDALWEKLQSTGHSQSKPAAGSTP
ncbi:MAG: hypothetical protein MUP47_09920 [Phycisphaerae bacterium]|nr:hypothetical protein [Phycisphaerae bacterium]